MALKTAELHQVRGITFAAKGGSNHWVIMDGSPELGGSNAGSSPKELLLMALAGCTASDVVPILQKKRVPFSDFAIRITAHDREEHPRILTDVHVEYIVYGADINPADVERAIELSTTKYCSVSAILRASVPLRHSFRIEPSEKAVARPEPVDQQER
ncbi:MAG: OsmC family protein [Ignavibacteriales bacterium]|nr:OsmC family protein [Ignavibacteriales bacterium]